MTDAGDYFIITTKDNKPIVADLFRSQQLAIATLNELGWSSAAVIKRVSVFYEISEDSDIEGTPI